MKLSIITINLNNAEGLRKTIDSVVSQTFTDFEYIIIDGGSTDGSVDIIKQYANAPLSCGERLGERLYWVSEPDKGIYNAMNKGILQAKGEYCLFLNSGDYLYSKDVLDKVFVENICEENIITGDMLKLYSDKIKTTELDKGQAYVRKQNGEDLTLFDMYLGTINHSSSFIKRKLFVEYGLYNENYEIVSDWVFFLKTIGLNGVQVKYLDLIVSCFDMSGISNNNTILLIKERKKGIEESLPKSVIDDYEHFKNLQWQYNEIKRRYDYIFKYKTTRFIAKAVNKAIRIFV